MNESTIKDVDIVAVCVAMEHNLETWFLIPGSVQIEFLFQK